MNGLTCVQCQARYAIDEAPAVSDGSFQCGSFEGEAACNCSGMIPRFARRVSERFPPEIAAPFTPMPDALMDHREELDLSPRELLVIWALERHRRTMGQAGATTYPSRKTLEQRTGLSDSSVKRAVSSLVEKKLLRRSQPAAAFASGKGGVDANNRYDLDPLWEQLAATVASTDDRGST